MSVTACDRLKSVVQKRAEEMWAEAQKITEGAKLHLDSTYEPVPVVRVTRDTANGNCIKVVFSNGKEGAEERRSVISFYEGSHVAEFDWADGTVMVTAIAVET